MDGRDVNRGDGPAAHRVLYVACDGTVRSGLLLESDGAAGGEPATTLVGEGGRPLAPTAIRALLALPVCRAARRAALARAHEAGYRVEEA